MFVEVHTLRQKLQFGALTAASVLLVLAIAAPVSAGTAAKGKLRFFHDSPDTPAVDVYVDGTRVLTNVSYGAVSRYMPITKANHLVAVKIWDADADDASDPTVLSRELTVKALPITLAAIGSSTGDGASLRLRAYVDRPGTWGRFALVRFAHTSPDAPAVDIQLRVGRSWVRIVKNLKFGETSAYVPLVARTIRFRAVKYDIRVVLHGTNTVVTGKRHVVLAPSRAVTAFVVGFATPPTGNTNPLALRFILNAWSPRW